jgi:hypothetical protein
MSVTSENRCHKTHLRYHSAYDSCYDKTEIFNLERQRGQNWPPTVRRLPPAENFSRRETVNVARNSVSRVCNYSVTERNAKKLNLTQKHNWVQESRIMTSKNYKYRTSTSSQWTHTVRQTQRMDLPVNLYSQWNFISLRWTRFCLCTLWLQRKFWSVKAPILNVVTSCILVDISTTLP